MLDTRISNLKMPPHSIEAEQAVIGGLMINHRAWDDVADLVSADDFYRQDHRLAFATVAKILEGGAEADVITVAEALDRAGQLDQVGGTQYLGHLQNETPSAANIVAYAKIVHAKSMLRQLAQVGHKVADDAMQDGDRDATEILDEAQREIMAIGEEQTQDRVVGLDAAWKDYLAELQQRVALEGALRGLSTGFSDLDEFTGGLQDEDLIIVAGRPSMGKTVLAQNLLEAACIGGGKRGLFFSLEMPVKSVMDRFVSNQSGVEFEALRSAMLDQRQWDGITRALQRTKDSGLFIDDRESLTVNQMRSTARRMKRRGGLDIIVVDYLTRMRLTNSKASRVEGIEDITRNLKSLARELKVPVVLLSQLNRGVEQRPDKRPLLSDLRESGGIEQDADVVLMLYRDDYYQPEINPGVSEVLVRKNRQGKQGTVRLMHQFHRMRFADFDPMLASDYASQVERPDNTPTRGMR